MKNEVFKGLSFKPMSFLVILYCQRAYTIMICPSCVLYVPSHMDNHRDLLYYTYMLL